MKGLTLVILIALVLVPAFVFAQAYQTSGTQAPVSQPLVREGTLAVKMVEALKLGKTTSEAEAESLLVSAGIAPRNGWIADYPVTPDIVGELRIAVSDAATSNTVTLQKDEAVKTFDGVIGEFNLSVTSDTSGQTANVEPSESSGDETVINNYYYNEGPPAVTYYAPPPDYAYLYSWVPYPFWWWDFWFPGFFILIDFHRTVFVDGHFAFVSSHFFDGRRFVRVDPVTRFSAASAVNRTRVIGPSTVTGFSRNSTVSNRSGTVAPFSGSRWTSTSRNSTRNSAFASPSGTGSRTFSRTAPANMNRTPNRTPNMTLNRTFRSPDRSATFNRQMTGAPRSFRGSSSTSSFQAPAGGGRTFSRPSGGGMSNGTSFSRGSFSQTFSGHGGAFRGR